MREDITGKKFNRLIVLGLDPDNKKNYLCECECGSGIIKYINYFNIVNGYIKSCGCIRKETSAKKLKDLTDKRFGWLVVTGFSHSKKVKEGSTTTVAYWNCLCDCGISCVKSTSDLTSGKVKSCGCQHYKEGSEHHSFKHGLRYHPLYKRFCHILERCYKETNKNYSRYGGRGVLVYQPWIDDRSLFIKYMEELYPNVYELIEQGIDQVDRYPNRNGNYEPGNIRLADSFMNNNNKDNNHMVDVFGEILTLANAVRKHGVMLYHTTLHRIKKGWHPEKALKEPNYNGFRPADFDKPYDMSEYPTLGVFDVL